MSKYTYDIVNGERDLSPVLSTVIQSKSNFVSRFPTRPDATAIKHEWQEDQITGRSITVASTVSNHAFTVSAADAAKLRVGTLLTIVDDAALFKVTVINGTTITVSLVAANGSSKTDPENTNVMRIVSTPELQGSTAGTDSFWQSGKDYNYTQIFRFDVSLVRSAMGITTYDRANNINVQVKQMIDQMARDINAAAIFGRRVDASAGVASEAGGLYTFGTQVGGLSVAAGGNALDSYIINDAARAITGAGGDPRVVLCNEGQASVISADMNNRVTVVRSDDVRGTYAPNVVNSVNGSNMIVVTDPLIPDTQCWVMDESGFGLSNLSGGALRDWDSGDNNFDGIKRSALAELTFEFKNAKQRLCLISGLMGSQAALAAKRSSSVS